MRSPTTTVYLLVFLNAALLTALYPLVPAFEEEFSLSKFQVGVLLGGGGLVFLVSAVPAGVLGDRLGARRVTIAGAAVLAVAAIGQALAVDFWTLLAARVVFSAGSASVLTAGVSWLAASAPVEKRSARIGGVMPVVGAGGLAGAALAGWLEDLYGTAVPFFVLTAIAVAVLALLAASEAGARATHGHVPIPTMLRAAHTVPLIFAACLLFLIAGLGEIVVSTLAPLQLDENGLSSGEIGLIFAAAAAAFVVASTGVARLGSRVIKLPVAGLAVVLLAVTLVPLVISTSSTAMTVAIIARMAAAGIVYTIAFPLGAAGAISAAVGVGAVNGLVMLSAGVAFFVGPLGGAAIGSVIDDRWVYAGLVGFCVVVAGWTVALARGQRAAAPRPAEADV